MKTFLVIIIFIVLVIIIPVHCEERFKRRYRHNFGSPVLSSTINEAVQGEDKKVIIKRENKEFPQSTKPPLGTRKKRNDDDDDDKEEEKLPTAPPPNRKTVPTTVTTTISTSSAAPESTTVSTTTTTTTTSSSSTTDVPVLVPPEIAPKQYFCLCDLKVSACDMNCCCDPDCNAKEKNLFTGCEGSLIYDSFATQNQEQSCVKSYIMYRDNIPYRVDRSDPSLFCVARENIKKTKEFSSQDMSRLKKRISHGKIDSKPKYNWDPVQHLDHQATPMFDPAPYKYGSPLFIIPLPEDDYKEEMFQLPAAYHNELCSLDQPILYLQDFKSHCILPFGQLKSKCETMNDLDANMYVKNFTVLLNPAKTADNLTDYPVENVIVARVCKNSMQSCRDLVSLNSTTDDDESFDILEVPDVDFPSPTLDLRSETCQNVLTQLNLTVIHSGIDGIQHVVAHALVTDVPLTSTYVEQSFTVKFIWERSTTITTTKKPDSSSINSTIQDDFLNLKSLPRSGNPGYLVGKPLILGQKVIDELPSNETSTPKLIQRMKVPHDSSHNLMIQGAGDCPSETSDASSTRSHPVLFGYEHISTCKLVLAPFTHCTQLQDHIDSVILGMHSKSFANSNFHVAAYGSPDAFPNDWIPLTFKKPDNPGSDSPFNLLRKGCDSILTSIHITVSFAYVGPVDSPQAKITGVFYEWEEHLRIPSSEGSPSSSSLTIPYLLLTTTVSFVDVTGKPVSRIATWPVVSIQLPADFFYPFSSSTSAPSSSSSSSNKRFNHHHHGQSLVTLGLVVVALHRMYVFQG